MIPTIGAPPIGRVWPAVRSGSQSPGLTAGAQVLRAAIFRQTVEGLATKVTGSTPPFVGRALTNSDANKLRLRTLNRRADFIARRPQWITAHCS
jgi:hypothetical protein